MYFKYILKYSSSCDTIIVTGKECVILYYLYISEERFKVRKVKVKKDADKRR